MKSFRGQTKTFPYKNKRKKEKENVDMNDGNSTQLPSEAQERKIFSSIDENFGFLNTIFGDGIGLIEAKYVVLEGKAEIGVAYIQGMIDTQLLSNQVVEPLLRGKVEFETSFFDVLSFIQFNFISISNIKRSNQMKQVVDDLLNGHSLLFIEGIDTALVIGIRKVEKRTIGKPDNEVTISGALDSLTEDLETNGTLIITRLPTPDLHFETFTIGKLSHTKIKLLWLEGIANIKLIEEARRRIEQIDIDAIEGIGFLAELIQDSPLSIFPKYRQTQRPDVIAKYLTDGRFAILCSDSPFALVAPASFWENFKSMDDYSETPFVASYLRITRTVSFALSILIGPLYLSFVTYNHSIVPPALALNIAIGRDGVPFPSVVELFVLIFSITIIREASMRISGSVGFFIGTLSAIVLGQASVTAGYVSASVIIVSAITAITSFAISTTTLVYTSRLTNYFLLILASMFGMFGVINGVVIILWHLLSLESFGVPYFYPLVPFDFEGMKDTIIRAPLSISKKRLRMLSPFNRTRINNKGE